MLSPLDDDWVHPYFRMVGHPELEALAAELGCDLRRVQHAAGEIWLAVKHEKIKPVSWDLAEFKRLVAERIGIRVEKPQIMAEIDDEEVPF